MEQDSKTLMGHSDQALSEWHKKEKSALELLNIVGNLRFDKSVELLLFRRGIYDEKPSSILSNMAYGKKYNDVSIDIDTVLQLAKVVANIETLPPIKLDIGKLAVEWDSEKSNYTDEKDFVEDKLKNFIGKTSKNGKAKDVVLYGFGRIGRLAARILINSTGKGEQLRLKAIVIRPKLSDHYEEAVKRAALLESDSVHGEFTGHIEVSSDGSEWIINGNRIQLIYASRPEDADYTQYGIKDALIIDNTGVWRDEQGLGKHLRPGANQVLLTAPAKGDIPNIVYGVNHDQTEVKNQNIFSAASCTTNAVVPALKVIDDKFGIEKGHIETIHAYTNDQNLLDNFHKKPRRGRGAPVNMVLTTTGAASAVTKVIPKFKDKLTGNAIRVPTPNVSMVILSLTLENATSVEELNEVLRQAAYSGPLVEQIMYSESTEYVSSNAIGMTATCVVDAPSTIVSKDGKNVNVYLWYDNEYGYTCQVVRVAKHLAEVRRFSYY